MYLDIKTGVSAYKQAQAALTAERTAQVKARKEVYEHIMPLLRDLDALPSWGDVRTITFYGAHLTVYLKTDRKDSHLPREIAQRFHATGHKSAGEDSLSVSFDLGGPRTLVVEGYLPATCRIERVREYIPAHEGYVSKVVCTGGDLEGTHPAADGVVEVPF